MIQKSDVFGDLEQRLGYTFKSSELLEQVLTHRSYANEKGMPQGNETLALLGDTVLQFFVTASLCRTHPSQRPGFLTEKRKSFVCQEILCDKAKCLRLGEAILFGRGEKLQGGPSKPSHLSEVFEALIGGIYLDGGLEAAVHFLSNQFQELEETEGGGHP